MKKNFCLFAIMILLSCSGKERQGFAHITQRRLQPGGKLMISYQFTAAEKIIYDSLELPNRILKHDSLRVIFSEGNPAHNHLVLP